MDDEMSGHTCVPLPLSSCRVFRCTCCSSYSASPSYSVGGVSSHGGLWCTKRKHVKKNSGHVFCKTRIFHCNAITRTKSRSRCAYFIVYTNKLIIFFFNAFYSGMRSRYSCFFQRFTCIRRYLGFFRLWPAFVMCQGQVRTGCTVFGCNIIITL